MLIRQIQQWILNITSFSILLIMLESIMPSNRYNKYVKVVCGFILAIIVIKPVIPLFAGKVDINELMVVNENKLNDMEINSFKGNFDIKQNEIIIKNYKKNLERQISEYANTTIKDYLVIAEATINEDRNSKDFGKVISLYLTLVPKNKDTITPSYENINKVDNINPIEGVKIEIKKTNEGIKNKNEENDQYNDAVKLKIQNTLIEKIASVFFIPDEKIYINFNGG